MKYLPHVWPSLAIFLCAALGLWLSVACYAEEKSGPPNPTAPKSIDELIEQLGSNRFEDREAATRELRTRKEAVPALRRALQSADPEIARRAELILPEVLRQGIRRLADNGEVDQLVERLVHRTGKNEEALSWQVVADLARWMAEPGKERLGPSKMVLGNCALLQAFDRYRKESSSKVITGGKVAVREKGEGFLIRGEEVTFPNHIGSSFIVSSGRVHTPRIISNSVVFANGSVEANSIQDSIVVCDGEVTVGEPLVACLVVARGVVRCNGAQNCTIVTCDSLRIPSRRYLHNCAVQEKVPTPLGWVQFFDPARVGVTVEAAEGGVRVKEVHEKKAFVKAGLRTGDVITMVGGSAAQSLESFRRLLRRAWACDDDVRLTVRRAEKVLDLSVPCQE